MYLNSETSSYFKKQKTNSQRHVKDNMYSFIINTHVRLKSTHPETVLSIHII